MAFTIPDVAMAWNAIQARIQAGDVQIMTDASAGVGVASGCAVTPQGSPNMTVAVASGTVRIGGASVSVTSGNVAITSNSSGQPRLDLICVNGSGTKSAQAGTAAATPKYPAIPASSVVLAAVLVPTGATSITANNIVDKRALVVSTTAGGLVAANNLSDVASASTSRTNLGVPAIAHNHAGTDITSATIATARLGSGSASSTTFLRGDSTWATPAGGGSGSAAEIVVALSDETTSLTTSGNPKLTMRMPHGMALTEVRSSLTTASSSGLVTVDINIEGATILSTKLSIDATEKTSTTAATAAVISTDELWDDAEITFDIDAAGTGAKGLKVALIGTRADIEPPAPSAVTFVASTNTTYGTRTTTTVTKPTGTIDGDVILLGIFTGASTEAPDPTPPAGFTILTGLPGSATDGSFEVETRIYVRVASSEGASWDFTHSSCASQGFALTYRGVSASTPIDVNCTYASGTGTTTTANQVTTVTNNAMLVFIAHDWGVNAVNRTAPTGFTERIEVNPLMYVAEKLTTTAGATGNVTFTNNNTGGSDSWGAVLVALRPA